MKLLRQFIKISKRHVATKVKTEVTTDKSVLENIENEELNPKLHPGVYKPRNIILPEKYVKAIENVLADYPVKALVNEGKSLARYLHARLPPIEQDDLKVKSKQAENEVLSSHCDVEKITETERKELSKRFGQQITNTMKRSVYKWQGINYDVYTSLQYLLGRTAQDYAVLMRIFTEINTRDPKFKPRSFFDFGSGVGIGSWVVHHFWPKYVFEYFNVDISADMNELALMLLKSGRGNKDPNIKGVFHRQFLPSNNTSYDIVLSAYSLLELPSSKSRLEVILKLWNKTEKYLVIVEQGTHAGFKVMNEARDFILQLENKKEQGKEAHAFSPCPHDLVCPKYLIDKSPCHFEISYMSLPIGQSTITHKEKFSYVVLKKGADVDEASKWPRIIQPILKRSKHAICNLCTAEGKLQEIIFTTSKHGKPTYYCARSSKWGDQLPISLKDTEVEIKERKKVDSKS